MDYVDKWRQLLHPIEVSHVPEVVVHRAGSPQVVAERLTLFYESPDNLKRHLKQHGGFTPAAEQCRDVAVCLRQGREMLRVARSADLMVRPIALYYGMAGYAKALALSCGQPKKLEAMPQGHGLSVPGTFGIDLAAIEVASDGDKVFQAFQRVLIELQGMPAGAEGKALWLEPPATSFGPTLEFSATLQALLARVVGLEDLYFETFAEPALIAQAELSVERYRRRPNAVHATLTLDLPKGTDHRWAIKLHPALAGWRVGEASRPDFTVLENLPPELLALPETEAEMLALFQPITDRLVPLAKAAVSTAPYRLVAPLQGTTLAQPALHLAAAFLLSSIARYRPDVWAEVAAYGPQGVARGLRLRAVLEAFFELADTRYPLDVLSGLGRRTIQVTSDLPAVWG